MTAPAAILETALYVDDLDAAHAFYACTLGLERIFAQAGRLFVYRCGPGVLLVFDPSQTVHPAAPGALPVPAHGARGEGHCAFAASADEIALWREKLEAAGVPIEADFTWPQGGRSIYVRDPAGNSIEFAEPRIWGI